MKLKFIFVYFSLAFFQDLAESANILGVFNLPSHSHHIWNERLSFALAQRGHNVTIVSHDKSNQKHENHTLIHIDGVYEVLYEELDLELEPSETGNLKSEDIFKYTQTTCDFDLKAPELDHLLNYPKDFKFDLIIWDTLNPECLYPLVKRFGNPRLVGLSAFGLQSYLSQIMGHPHFAYYPFLTAAYSDKMTFWEKLVNIYENIDLMMERRKNLKVQREKAIAKFGNDIDDFDEIEKKYDFILVNYDPVMDYPQPLPPNIIPVGGMQIKPTTQLPQDLRKTMDESKNGVIFFSLGSNIKSEEINKEKIEAFTKCFESLPYTVLWKIKDPDFKLPKNVFVKSWFPQGDILAHKNTKLFITHGGALSTQESMYHGVPMIILPFFLDQFNNAYKMELKKVGKKIIFKNLTPDYVCDNIKHIINTKEYQENVEIISKRVKDQLETPVERAIFWTEHVLRQGSSSYLSLATREMGSMQIYHIDILLFVIIIITSTVLALVFFYNRIFAKKNTSQSNPRKNKRE